MLLSVVGICLLAPDSQLNCESWTISSYWLTLLAPSPIVVFLSLNWSDCRDGFSWRRRWDWNLLTSWYFDWELFLGNAERLAYVFMWSIFLFKSRVPVMWWSGFVELYCSVPNLACDDDSFLACYDFSFLSYIYDLISYILLWRIVLGDNSWTTSVFLAKDNAEAWFLGLGQTTRSVYSGSIASIDFCVSAFYSCSFAAILTAFFFRAWLRLDWLLPSKCVTTPPF